MGIEYSGSMIVGAKGSQIPIPEDSELDFSEYLEELGLDRLSTYYDCGPEYCYWGFEVMDVEIFNPEFKTWLDQVHELASKFEKLTGAKANLIGTQNIW